MRLAVFAGAFVLTFATLFGQDNPAFEVASVKPSPVPGPNERVFFGPPRGGPGTRDPGQITWTRAALRNMLMTAYDIQTFQLEGPGWLSTERYDIIAKVPEGATKEQVNIMWQNLLKERFGLTLHHESREFQVDELTVAKGGAKLTPTDLESTAEPFAPTPGPLKLDKNGRQEMNGYGAIITIFPGANGTVTAHIHAKGLTVAELVLRMGPRRPVIDKAGLIGRYDVDLDYTPDLTGLPPPPSPQGGAPPSPSTGAPGEIASDPGSTMASALEKQLGLKLTASKAKLDVIIVDHAEKAPTAN